MNNKFKLTSAILSVSLLVTPISAIIHQNDNVAKAEELNTKQSPLKIKFPDFSISFNEYNSTKFRVEYSSNLTHNIATIIDLKTNSIIEKIYYKKNLTRAYEFSTTLSRDLYFGNTIVKVNVDVNVGYEGSFRWIKSIGNKTMYIIKHKGETAWISGGSVSAFLNSNNPSQLNVSISGHIFVKGDYNAWRHGYYNAGSGLDAKNITSSTVLSLY